MAFFDDITEGVKKVFVAGVGAVALGAEKSQDLVDDLIKRGEITIEQGKALNEELVRKVKETRTELSDEVLRTRLRGMTPEERAAWIANIQKISDDLEAEDAEYEVEEDEATAEAEAAEPEAEEAEPEAAEAEPEAEPEAVEEEAEA